MRVDCYNEKLNNIYIFDFFDDMKDFNETSKDFNRILTSARFLD